MDCVCGLIDRRRWTLTAGTCRQTANMFSLPMTSHRTCWLVTSRDMWGFACVRRLILIASAITTGIWLMMSPRLQLRHRIPKREDPGHHPASQRTNYCQSAWSETWDGQSASQLEFIYCFFYTYFIVTETAVQWQLTYCNKDWLSWVAEMRGMTDTQE